MYIHVIRIKKSLVIWLEKQQFHSSITLTCLIFLRYVIFHFYFLFFYRGENGFLHVRICCNIDSEENDPYASASNRKSFTLATLPERRFETVAAAVNHCANIGVYSRHLPPVILKYPLTEESV